MVDGGTLRSNKGMNLPGVALSTPALTEKDRRDLAFGVQHQVDYVAMSFVRRAEDVLEAKELIRSMGETIPVIAKIEKPEAIDNLASILAATDGVMVARGDLGVELGTEDVPIVQKRIIAMANAAGKVVITATQMLESMIENPRPTRAEASDVANAILDGTDAVMLSGESAVGKFPVETVETMARIADYTEEHGMGAIRPRRADARRTDAPPAPAGPGTPITRSLTRVAASVAEELDCKLILAFTESGITARLVAGHRPRMPVVAVTHEDRVYRQLAPVVGRRAHQVRVRREHRRPAGRGRGAPARRAASSRRATPSSCSPATPSRRRRRTCCGSTRSRDVIPRDIRRDGSRGIRSLSAGASARRLPGMPRGLTVLLVPRFLLCRSSRPARATRSRRTTRSRRRRSRRSAPSSRASPPGTVPGYDGKKTSSGEVFDQDALTAAHAYWAFGTRVR